ncbi:hypothetical protein Tco_1021101 [Tanacetum coccineum]
METKEVCKRYITLCFMKGIDAYDGITDLEYEKILISNEFAVKLRLQYEVKKNGEKGVNRKLLVALKGELYFVGFVINPEEDDVEPGVIFGRSFLKISKAIVDFGNNILTIYPDIITFNSDSDDELDAILVSINLEELPSLYISNFPPFVIDEELTTKNSTKFILGGRGHSLSLLEFAHRLGLYTSAEIQEEAFEMKRKGVGTQKESMICYGQFVTRLVKKMQLLTNDLDRLSAPIYFRSLDATILRELNGPNGRLIAEDPTPGVLGFAMPRTPRLTLQDLYDRMGRMKIQQGVLERMSRRRSYHYNRYAGVFEYMAGHYEVPLARAYAPPGYDEEQQH